MGTSTNHLGVGFVDHAHRCVPEDGVLGVLAGGGNLVPNRMDPRHRNLVWGMVMEMVREQLDELLVDGYTLLEPSKYDAAIVGIVERNGIEAVVAYDLDQVIRILVEDGMEHHEAIEFYMTNIVGAWMGDHTPAFVTLINTGEK